MKEQTVNLHKLVLTRRRLLFQKAHTSFVEVFETHSGVEKVGFHKIFVQLKQRRQVGGCRSVGCQQKRPDHFISRDLITVLAETKTRDFVVRVGEKPRVVDQLLFERLQKAFVTRVVSRERPENGSVVASSSGRRFLGTAPSERFRSEESDNVTGKTVSVLPARKGKQRQKEESLLFVG